MKLYNFSMTLERHKKLEENTRSNTDYLLLRIATSDDFMALKNKYFSDDDKVLLGLYRMTSSANYELSLKLERFYSEFEDKFQFSRKTAKRLLFLDEIIAPARFDYTPVIYRDEDSVYIKIGPKTTLNDIKNSWSKVVELKKELGRISGKKSNNTELAFCIYSRIIKGDSMSKIFQKYIGGSLENYNLKPTILDENEFRKYYRKIVKGL